MGSKNYGLLLLFENEIEYFSEKLETECYQFPAMIIKSINIKCYTPWGFLRKQHTQHLLFIN